MSLNNTINSTTLWATLTQWQNELEKTFQEVVKDRKLSAFTPMVPLLRGMHWASAFLGIVDLADITAMGALYITRIQKKHSKWSIDLSTFLESLLAKSREFIDARPDNLLEEVSADKKKTVPHGANLKWQVHVDDVKNIFKRQQMGSDFVSTCQEITLSHGTLSHNKVTLPSFARKRHQTSRYLSLVYIDLGQQESGFDLLAKNLDAAFRKSDILLYGPLNIPQKNHQEIQRKKTCYLLLDTVQESQHWLKSMNIKGKNLKVLKTPDNTSRAVIEKTSLNPPARPREHVRSDSPEQMKELKTVDKRSAEKGEKRYSHVSFSVGAKLILIVSIILISSMSILAYVSIYFFKREIKNQIEDTNMALSHTVSKQAEDDIEQFFDLSNLIFQIGSVSGGPSLLIDDFFYNYQSLIYVGIPGSEYDFSNRKWFRDNRISDPRTILNTILAARLEDLEKARNGEVVIVNVSPYIPNLKNPVLALAAPFLLGAEQEFLVVLVDIGDNLAKIVNSWTGQTTTMIINSTGEILAHPDTAKVFDGENLRDSPVFKTIYSQGINEGQIRYKEFTSSGQPVKVMGSFKLLPVGNLGVVTSVLEKDAFSVVTSIQILNWSLLATVLSLAVLAVYFFAQSISRPLKKLTVATRMIKTQDYDSIFIKPKTSDEVGQLTRDFMTMIPHLQARERLREKTEAFINKQVAEMIDSGTLPDLAKTKDVTVLFSDVRRFTRMSERMGDPQIVLNNLSAYFRAMVPCVNTTRGTVDKFIGDALMAVWGSMQELENNAESAINGSLMMRVALKEFNSDRDNDDDTRPHFHIGCGLNSGLTTVGIMGDPYTKMEWSHIGDTVNLASRIESLNKPMGTDILISQNTKEKVNGIFHLVPMKKIKVKGKSESQQIYAVLGRMDDESRPRTLTELRTMMGIKGDFSMTYDPEAHETKYEILDS